VSKMPLYDGTGPNGQGAMTGRGAGSCSSDVSPGYGLGAGRGRPRCRAFGFVNKEPSSKADEKKAIENRISAFKKEIDILNDRINSLENEE
jgi:hypothetical protein